MTTVKQIAASDYGNYEVTTTAVERERLAHIETIATIASVKAVSLPNRKVRVIATLENGTELVLKKSSTMIPVCVQAYDFEFNGNARGLPAHFTFAKKVCSYYPDRHLRTIPVANETTD